MTMDASRPADGFRRAALGGAQIRADIVDVYIFRRASPGPEFLQLLRAKTPLDGTWQPIMGHCEADEPAERCAVREMAEEVGLTPTDPSFRGLWALEQVHPFYLAALNCIVLSPRFVVEVDAGWAPRLNREHREARWVPAGDVGRRFMWPGQRAAIREALEEVVPLDALNRRRQRLGPGAC